MRLLTLAALALLPAPATAAAQQGATMVASRTSPRDTVREARAGQATAVRTARPPVLDGDGADEMWATAPAITDFRIFDPNEGSTPPHPTTAKVAYDDRNLYILVRAHEVHGDSVRGMLSRRDMWSPSDWIWVMVDSYHDKRTAYEFAVNPVGVKRDVYNFNDGNEDQSWDAVWDVATRVDSAGWTAEFAIPWSQLRYPEVDEHTIGLMIIRDVGRRNERQSWPLLRRNSTGMVSQFGTVGGIRNLPSARRLEVMPYVVQKEYNLPRAADGFAHRGQLSAGADVKWGLTSNLTVDATINPDFGQVEADPATYNLGTTELFFSERRPFFMEGMGIFRFDLSCNDGECTGLFYSRRVGQRPLLAGSFGDAQTSAFTTILGAAKLTGRFRNGLSVGLLNATTQREFGRPITEPLLDANGDTVRHDDAGRAGEPVRRATGRDYIVQPLTNYAVARAQQEFRGGNSVVGVMATGVNRALDGRTEALLHRDAYAAGLDLRHRFAKNTWQVSGYAAASRVGGTPEAIALTQQGIGVHNFQRVDADHLEVDETRTSLAGATQQLWLDKTAGAVRLSTGYQRRTPGFDVNDAGYLGRADQQSYNTWVGVRFNTPRAFYRRIGLNFNNWVQWNIAGDRLDAGGNVNGHSQLANNWFVFAGTGMGQFSSYNDRDARGGPAFRRSPSMNNWVGFESDARKPVMVFAEVSHWRGDYGRSRGVNGGPGVQIRPSSRFSVQLNPRISRSIDDSQWYRNVTDDAGTTHYTFAHLDQRTLSLTSRVDFAATPTLSMQLYAAPFITTGSFTDPRELAPGDARNRDYATRFQPYLVDGTQPTLAGFNFKQFNSNAVLRWEYRPGSSLFLVWSQGRIQDDRNPGSFEVRRDTRDLFRAHPQNTFLIKGSYWLSL